MARFKCDHIRHLKTLSGVFVFKLKFPKSNLNPNRSLYLCYNCYNKEYAMLNLSMNFCLTNLKHNKHWSKVFFRLMWSLWQYINICDHINHWVLCWLWILFSANLQQMITLNDLDFTTNTTALHTTQRNEAVKTCL